jgi:hypothetical protein
MQRQQYASVQPSSPSKVAQAVVAKPAAAAVGAVRLQRLRRGDAGDGGGGGGGGGNSGGGGRGGGDNGDFDDSDSESGSDVVSGGETGGDELGTTYDGRTGGAARVLVDDERLNERLDQEVDAMMRMNEELGMQSRGSRYCLVRCFCGTRTARVISVWFFTFLIFGFVEIVGAVKVSE